MIPHDHLDIYEERLKLFHELPLSLGMAMELTRGYRNYLIFKMTLEQMAAAKPTNTQAAEWAANVLRIEPTRPQHRRRSAERSSRSRRRVNSASNGRKKEK